MREAIRRCSYGARTKALPQLSGHQGLVVHRDEGVDELQAQHAHLPLCDQRSNLRHLLLLEQPELV